MPETIGHYLILDRIGSGGIGRVYRGLDTRLKRSVALKLLRPEQVRNRGRDRFIREAVIASSLTHPNIAGVVDHSSQRPGNFLTLCGLEPELWTALTHGASGAVLPFASAAPYAAIALWEAFRTREEDLTELLDEAARIGGELV